MVFAIGHSSRDTFETLYDRGVHIEAKPFSIGFRIEHPQSWIDQALFGPCAGHPDLGAAAYTLSHHCSNGRTVYSFCMCPGGTVVAATSEPGRVVTNGMSQYSRNERNANSGFVVGISPEDYPSDHPLAGIELQRELESRGLCGRRRRLFRAGPAGRRLPGGPRLDRAGRGRAQLQAGRAADRPGAADARLCDRRHARGPAGLRPQDPPLRRRPGGADRASRPAARRRSA